MRSGGSNGLASRPRKAKVFAPATLGGERDKRSAIVHKRRQRRADPIPFQHREFRRVQRRAFAVAENVRQREDLRLAGGEELLHREFGRGMQPGLARHSVRADEAGAKAVQVGLVARRDLKGGGVDLDETLGVEPVANELWRCARARKPRPAGGVTVGAPERRGRGQTQEAPKLAVGSRTIHMAFAAEISIKRADVAGAPDAFVRAVRRAPIS